MWLTALKYLLVGAICWFIGSFGFGATQNFVARSEPARLIVLQIDTRSDTDGFKIYRPVYGLDTTVRPRPEFQSDTWARVLPFGAGDYVDGRYDRRSGAMQSNAMLAKSRWLGWLSKIIGGLAIVQGFLILLGLPELLMPLRVRIGHGPRY